MLSCLHKGTVQQQACQPSTSFAEINGSGKLFHLFEEYN